MLLLLLLLLILLLLLQVLGSDHCPVVASYHLLLSPASKPPAAATLHFLEFTGRQSNIKNYFTKGDGKRAAEEHKLNVVKKAKPEKKKITSFFAKVTTPVKETKADENTNALSASNPHSLSPSPPPSPPPTRPPRSQEAKTAWSAFFKPPAPAPSCPGHQVSC